MDFHIIAQSNDSFYTSNGTTNHQAIVNLISEIGHIQVEYPWIIKFYKCGKLFDRTKILATEDVASHFENTLTLERLIEDD